MSDKKQLINKLSFIGTLLAVIENRCPACGAESLHSATLKGEPAVSCTECDWIESITQWKRDATGRATVLRLRDEFLQLVDAYNRSGDYKKAMDAQSMAIQLNTFEDQHDITDILWPAQVAGEDYDKWLKRLEDLEAEQHEQNKTGN